MSDAQHPEQLFEAGGFTREVSPQFTVRPDVGQSIQTDPTEQLLLYPASAGVVTGGEAKKGKRVAFGGFLKPILYDPAGEYDLSQVPEAEKAWMTKDHIAEALFDPPRTYTALVVDNIALNPVEHKILVRYPKALARQAYASVLGENDLDQETIASARRGIVHQLERKREPMAEHLAKLREARQDVRHLRREEDAPGFAHKSVDWMNEHVSTTWSEFQIMLDVIRAQRGWDDTQAQRAQAAFINYLTSGPQRGKVANWRGMTDLADNYLGARIHLFGSREKEVDAIIAQYPIPAKDEASIQ